MKRIILASSSPRRKALLAQIGLTFETDSSDIAEKLNPRLKPRGNAEQLSLKKARAIADKYQSNETLKPTNRYSKDGVVILAADTLVVLDDEILGKAKDKFEARKILRKLSGREHAVVTGFTIIDTRSGKTVTQSVETKVFFRKLSMMEIDAYVKSGEPMGKAGAYSMQEKAAIFVVRIEGDPYNVTSLPLYKVTEELKKFGIKVL